MRGPVRRLRHPQSPIDGTGMAAVGTMALHTMALAVLFMSPPLIRRAVPPVYSVQLVAAPRPEPERRRAPEVVQRPAEPAPVSSRPARRTTVAETPPPPERQVEREPAPRTNPVEELAPEAEPSTGADVATVKTTGIEFPYPEYLRNIVAQIYRRWHRPSGNVSLRAEVLFFVHRDGSISNFQFITRSGNFAFDLEAQGAIEEAGRLNAFGPLPAGYAADILPVSFFFDPSTAR